MADGGEETEHLAVPEHGLDQPEVGKVGAAVIRIVEDPDVALVDAALLRGLVDDRLHGKGHDADEDRQAGFTLHQGLAGVRIVDAVGGVMGLGDDRVEGGAEQGRVHFVGDLFQTALQDCERDRIYCHQSASSSYFLASARMPGVPIRPFSPAKSNMRLRNASFEPLAMRFA